MIKKKTMYQRAYYVLFVFNRLLMTGTLVYLYDYPLLQLVIIFVCQISVIAYSMKFRPFKSELQQVISVTDEFTIIFGLILLYFLRQNQNNIDSSSKIAFAIIGVIVFSIMKNMSVIFYISITNAYSKFRSWVHKKIDYEKNKKKSMRQKKKKDKEEKQKAAEEEEMMRAFFRGNLSPSQMWYPGQPSIIDSMIRVERPVSVDSSISSLSDTWTRRDTLINELKNLNTITSNDKPLIVNQAEKILYTIAEDENEQE